LHEECNGNGYKLVQFVAATDIQGQLLDKPGDNN